MRPLLLLLALGPALAAQGLPPVPVPPGNPQSPAKIVLGKILFFEEQVGRANSSACATCHMPEVGGGDPRVWSPLNRHPGPDGLFGTADDVRGSRGVVHCDSNGNFTPDGIFFPFPQVTARKAPPAVMSGYDPETFWDGRAGPEFRDPVTQAVLLATGGALEAQAVLPPTSGEMSCAATTIAVVAQRLTTARPLRLAQNIPADVQAALAQAPDYPALFAAAFGDPAVTPARFAMAVAAYERTLIPDQTPFDAFQGGNPFALTPSQQAGLAVFTAHCAVCHPPPLFTDHSFRNVGVRPPAEDIGRQAVTGLLADRGKFKVPSLRNVGLRAPYFHNGGQVSLFDVVQFYDRGGDFADNRDPLIQPLGLSHAQKLQLVDFLQHALTDPRVAAAQPPFDRPVLRSELGPNPLPYGYRTAGSGAILPEFLAPSPPMIGSDRVGLGVAQALGGATAVLGLSLLPATPGTLLGPIPLWVNLAPDTLLLPFPLGGAPGVPGAGYATLNLVIPDDPILAGLVAYAQWVVIDPGATGSLATTEGVQISLIAP
jgi:cytochrome c peroxidase